jgi:hypothetical protein
LESVSLYDGSIKINLSFCFGFWSGIQDVSEVSIGKIL